MSNSRPKHKKRRPKHSASQTSTHDRLRSTVPHDSPRTLSSPTPSTKGTQRASSIHAARRPTRAAEHSHNDVRAEQDALSISRTTSARHNMPQLANHTSHTPHTPTHATAQTRVTPSRTTSTHIKPPEPTSHTPHAPTHIETSTSHTQGWVKKTLDWITDGMITALAFMIHLIRKRPIAALGLIIALITLIAAGGVVFTYALRSPSPAASASHDVTEPSTADTPASSSNETTSASTESEAAAKAQPTEEEPANHIDFSSASSLQVLVNKGNPLPESYTPELLVDLHSTEVPVSGSYPQLRQEAADALVTMYAAASNAGAPFMLQSGYRSYTSQSEIFSSNTRRSGQASAETYSARPGYSEHQTGLAADLIDFARTCNLENCFADTTAGIWLAEHAWEYGFILRYPKDLSDLTGYIYEPWHFRFIGTDAARAYHESGASTYEEFLGVTPTPNYPE